MDSTHAMIAQAWKDQTPHVRLDRIFGVTHVSRDNCGKEKAIDASRSMQSIVNHHILFSALFCYPHSDF